MTFPEFNAIVNPSDVSTYLAQCTHLDDTEPKTYKEILSIARANPNLAIAWILPKQYAAYKVSSKALINAILTEKPDVFVFKDNTDYWIVTEYGKLSGSCMLGCGIITEVIANQTEETQNYIRIPFHNKVVCKNKSVLNMEIIHAKSKIAKAPTWLAPVKNAEEISQDFSIEYPLVGNPSKELLKLVGELKTLTIPQQRAILKIVNNNLALTALTSDELDRVLEASNLTEASKYFSKGTFLHDKFGNYIIEKCFVKRDKKSGELFYYNNAQKIYVNDPDYLLGYMTKYCPSLKSYQKDEALKYIYQYLYDDVVEFNKNPFTIVFKNGVLDLATMSITEMSPEHLETIKINCDYDPEAKSETADEFFATATAGNKEIEQLLYEAIGYSMLKTAELQKAFILVGGGRNGKSTYFDIIKNLLGKENTTSISFKDLSNNFRASALKGKLASLAGDISSQPITDSDLIKSISCGEDVMIEEKYKKATEESLFATMFFACNKLPRTPDTSDGFYRRWTIIPFIANLSSVSRVDGMLFKQKLLTPESLNYIAYKALNAIHRVLTTTNEFTEPEVVKNMMHEYQVDNSAVLSWFKEVFENDISKLKTKKLSAAYLSYTQWCQSAGRIKSSQTTFKTNVKAELGIDLK